jgi:hypothetical protein
LLLCPTAHGTLQHVVDQRSVLLSHIQTPRNMDGNERPWIKPGSVDDFPVRCPAHGLLDHFIAMLIAVSREG